MKETSKEIVRGKDTFQTEVKLHSRRDSQPKSHVGLRKHLRQGKSAVQLRPEETEAAAAPRTAVSQIKITNANQYLHFLKDGRTNSASLSWVTQLRDPALFQSHLKLPTYSISEDITGR